MKPVALSSLLGAVILGAEPAFAHVLPPGTPLSESLHHPAFESVHWLAFIAGGLWAGQQPAKTGWIWVAAMVAGVALGVVFGALAWLPPWRSSMAFIVIATFGIATAIRWKPSCRAGIALFCVAGFYEGVIGSIPEYMGGSGHSSPVDIAVAAIVQTVLARELAVRARPQWARIVICVAGSWIAAAGILLLAFTLRLSLGLPASG